MAWKLWEQWGLFEARIASNSTCVPCPHALVSLIQDRGSQRGWLPWRAGWKINTLLRFSWSWVRWVPHLASDDLDIVKGPFGRQRPSPRPPEYASLYENFSTHHVGWYDMFKRNICFRFTLFLIMCLCLHLSMFICGRHLMDKPGRVGTPWCWNYRQLWATWCGYRELNWSPLQEQDTILTTDPFSRACLMLMEAKRQCWIPWDCS